MKKHLKYIDGSSDKFWQIETSANQLTVTYGRNGTSGTSQTKTFGSDEECEKAAEKLLAEKVKKGYSESGEVLASGTPKAATSQKQSNLKAVLEGFDEIIKNREKSTLLQFLKESVPGNVTEFRKHLTKSKRYWMTYTDLSKEPEFKRRHNYDWGTRGDEHQSSIIVMAAIATFDKASLKPWSNEIFWELEKVFNDSEPWRKDVFEYAKPDWLIDFYLDIVRQKESWQTPDYKHLVYLEDNGFIQFNAEVVAHSLAKFTNTTHSRHGKDINCMEFMLARQLSYERDVPELFNYETDIANSRNWGGTDNGLRLWHQYFKELVEAGKVDRAFVLQKSFEIQTKEWNNGIKTFFRTLIEQLNPTTDELLSFQPIIFPGLQNSLNAIVNFGIENIKKVYEEPGFDFNAFMEWVGPALLRTDIKAGIKTLLQIFDKKAKADASLKPALTSLAADVFNVPVLELQERAAKLISQHGDPADAELGARLEMYRPLMLGRVSDTLSAFLPKDTTTIAEQDQEDYHYKPTTPVRLADAVQIPQTWNDILFQFGQFVNSDAVIDVELLWNAYATQRHLFPEDYQQQLQPYLKQISKNHYGNEIYCSCYKCASEHYFKTKFHHIGQPFTYKKANHSHELKLFDVSFDLLKKIDDKIAVNSTLPLLSFPTHLPFWVAPKTLLERIIAYQQTNEAIDRTDLSIAISRMPRENLNEAMPLLEQLTGELKELMSFCLGLSDDVVLETKGTWDKLKGIFQGNAETEKTNITSVWAVAARTFFPDKTFEAFSDTYLNEVPFVINAFRPPISFKEKWNEYYVNYQTKEKARTPSWWEMNVDLPQFKKVPGNLLYSVDMYNKGSRYYYDNINTEAQGNCYFGLMPQNNDSYAIQIIRDSGVASSGKQGIDTLLSNISWVRVSYYSYLVWALGFFNDKKELRAKAAEVLYAQIAEANAEVSLLSTTLALLVNNKYGVFSRLTDALASLKDTTPQHNHALWLLLDGLFAQLTVDALPNQFKKMLEMYYDLKLKTKSEATLQAKAFLEKWADQGSIKKMIKEITNH